MAQQLRASDFLPPKFLGNQGQNPMAHWLSFSDYCTMHQLPDAQKIERFKITLGGEARTWIDGKQFANVNALRQRFLEQFSGMHTRDGTVKMFRKEKYRMGEAVESYCTRLRMIANQLNYNQDMVKDQFLDGLPDNVATAASMANADNLDAMVTAAQRYIDRTGSAKQVSFSLAAQEEMVSSFQNMYVSESDSRDRGRSREQERGRSASRERSGSRNFRQDRFRDNSRDNFRQDRYNSQRNRSYSRDRGDSRDRYDRYNRERGDSRDRYDRYGSQRGRSRYRTDRNQYRTRNNPNQDKTCDVCKIKGHLWRQCRKLRQMIRDGSVQVQEGF